MSAPWLTVLGLGEDGLPGLGADARARLDAAELLVGGRHHLDQIPDDGRPRWTWPRPLTDLIPRLLEWRGCPVCVLATGNPQYFGVGVTLGRHIPAAEMLVIPAPSAFSLACARLGWSQADLEAITLHGRPLESLNAHLAPGQRLLVLSENGTTPGRVASLLCERGYGASEMTVLEHMGGPAERRQSARAADWGERTVADFNTIALELHGAPDTPLRPRTPGLPDEAFEHDGMLTKREVRAAVLAALAPLPGQLLWDVGAGSGAVAIEWLRAARGARAIAIERKTERLTRLRRNAAALGTPGLVIAKGEAPAALAGLPAPDAVFIGGGLTAEGLAEACWTALAPGGRLAANAVTLEGEQRLAELCDRHGGEMSRIAVSRLKPVGPYRGWSLLMPVTLWAVRKPAGSAP